MSQWWKDTPAPKKPKVSEVTRLPIKFRTVHEIADYLRCNKDYVYDLINKGELPHVVIGKKKLVPEEALEAFVRRKGA